MAILFVLQKADKIFKIALRMSKIGSRDEEARHLFESGRHINYVTSGLSSI